MNLLDASRKLGAVIDAAASAADADAASVTASAIEYAEAMQAADIASNRAIGRHGMRAMLQAAQERRGDGGEARQLRVLTHCNTGSLATVQYGTALGCIRALHESGHLERAYCTETRCALWRCAVAALAYFACLAS